MVQQLLLELLQSDWVVESPLRPYALDSVALVSTLESEVSWLGGRRKSRYPEMVKDKRGWTRTGLCFTVCLAHCLTKTIQDQQSKWKRSKSF